MSTPVTFSLKVTVAPSRKEMGIAAGVCGEQYLVEALNQKDTVRVIMGSAPSQDDVLGYLRDSTKIDWSRIEVFHMDEYIGISQDDPRSFSSYLDRTLFSVVKPKVFHKIQADKGSPQEVCDAYAALLNEAPIDIVFLGVGENGHIAFNDPPVANLKDPETVKAVELDEICRMQQVHDGTFPAFDDVPTHAITLTVSALMRGKHLVCTVPTDRKTEAIHKMLTGPIGADCPATAMRLHPDANLFLDHESGAGLADMKGVQTTL